MSDRLAAIKEVEGVLKKLFPIFEPKGVLAFYIWGSLTREDYNPRISDIDSIFILSDSSDPELPNEIKKRLAALLPAYHEIGGTGIYLSELNGGPSRGFFAQLHPWKIRSVLTTFSDWYYVCGKKFNRQDFQALDLSVDEQIQNHLENALGIIKNLNDPRRNWRKDLLKQGLALAYHRAVKAKGYFALNYDNLASYALSKDKSTIELLVSLRKKANYEKDDFDKNIPVIQSWLDGIESNHTR